MKKRHLKRVIALACIAALSLTGCNSFVTEDVTSYPLVSKLTTAEVIDYYAKSLEYDAIVSRNVEVHETEYVTYDVTGEKAERLKGLVGKAEAILANTEYDVTEENLAIMSPDTFGYIKTTIDNESLSNSNIKQIKGALGYYFVDVEYDIAPSQIGAFKQTANLVSLDGALYEDPLTHEWKVDTAYIQQVVNKMNQYYLDNLIFKEASFDESTCKITIEKGHLPVGKIQNFTNDNTFYSDESLINGEDTTDENVEGTENTEESEDVLGAINDVIDEQQHENTEETEETESTEVADDAENTEGNENITNENGEETENTEDVNSDNQSIDDFDKSTISGDFSTVTGGTSVTQYNSITSEDRKIQLDINLINSIVGSSLKHSSEMPPLDTVYDIPESNGDISGYGISNGGGDGLKVFGFDRSQLSGKLTIRYVFKDDSTGSGEILGTNAYIIDEEITTGIKQAENNILVPDFLMTEFEKLIERSDRLQADNMLASSLSGNVYEDIGIGILMGTKGRSTNTLKCMSTIRQVIDRDTMNNAYVIEVESTVIDGARDVDCYGTYRDKSYVVIQQQGTEFKIIDWARISRQVTKEAPINPDSAIIKRLVALNLAGEIPEESKDSIKKLLSDLYTAGTNRILRGPKELEVNGQVITVEKGMYDCFQNDTSILPESDLEYINSSLRNKLTNKGIDVQAIYSGIVTDWIGGYDNQAEFTTEELITYVGTGEAHYMQVYYLVSNLNDVWVIDEMTILDEYKVTDPNILQSIKERVGQ